MKSRYHKLLAGLTMAATAVSFLGAIPSALAQPGNSGLTNAGAVITTPDAGASFVLLGLGFSGLAIAARKRFKKR
jgi:hypothetical protein